MQSDLTFPIPLYYNPDAGSWEKRLETIGTDPRIEPQPVCTQGMVEEIKQAVQQGVKRVLVSGGDGTIALAAAALAGKATELAVIPAGTLNHFAQRTGIPIPTVEAVHLALHGTARPVDVGYANDSLFINTSSVGAYPIFVRSRNHLEHRMHYFPASIIAGLRRLWRFRSIRIKLADRILRTPLVFIGVGERELRMPAFGQTKQAGQDGLHLLAVNCDSKFKVLLLVIKSFFWGIDPMHNEMVLENQLVERVELNFHQRHKGIHVALDGELHWLHTPLTYRLAKGEIMVVMPQLNKHLIKEEI